MNLRSEVGFTVLHFREQEEGGSDGAATFSPFMHDILPEMPQPAHTNLTFIYVITVSL